MMTDKKHQNPFKKITLPSWIILIVTLGLTYLFLGQYGFGQPDISMFATEPTTTRETTSTDGFYSNGQITNRIEGYKNLTAVVKPESGSNSVAQMLVQPGLKATKTIAVASKGIDVCTTMTPQGVAITDKYLITSAYDHDAKHYSVLYVQDLKTKKYLNTVVLNGIPHVGGITYDADHDLIWFCGKKNNYAEIIGIKLEDLLSYNLDETGKPVKYEKAFTLQSIQRASFISYYQNTLFVGFFNVGHSGNVQHYKVNDNGNIIGASKQVNTESVTNQIAKALFFKDTVDQAQGIVFYGKYAFVSQSYGPGDAKLLVFKANLKQKTFRQSDVIYEFKTPSHLEQINIAGDKMYLTFESSAYAYRHNSTNPMDRIVSLDLPKLISKIDKHVGA